MPYLSQLQNYMEERHPRSLAGVREARQVAPERFDAVAEMYLDWAVKARGAKSIAAMADSFVRFCTDVNLAQAHYERDGHYQHTSYAECYAQHYNQDDIMEDYLWGIYLTNFLWAHHLEIALFYHDRFLQRLGPARQIIEIAPGHGGWGTWALSCLSTAQLVGYDISPASIDIATQVATAARVKDRATYLCKNALDLFSHESASADAVLCNFLIEHLEQPSSLFAVIHHLLKPRGLAFVAGALTAAQVDHIYEFHRESELMRMAEDHGLRVLETFSGSPRRTLPRARFLPRSMALLVQKRVTDTW